MLAENLLIDFGATEKSLAKDAVLFREGETAQYYFQVTQGKIKMNNYNDHGKEFLQGMFSKGESFGEPPLLIGEKYPANAIAVTDAVLLKLPRIAFLELLETHPQAAVSLSMALANRLYYKAVMASEIASHDPEHRLVTLLDYFKFQVYGFPDGEKFEVPLTRQQLADLTGLRVETVIRSVKALEKKGQITIENRKIFR